MSASAERIASMHQRVDRLLKDHHRLRAAHSALEQELRDARRNGDVLQARITELERENEVLRSVKAGAGDRSGSKERIDELVSEIDRCLALLNA